MLKCFEQIIQNGISIIYSYPKNKPKSPGFYETELLAHKIEANKPFAIMFWDGKNWIWCNKKLKIKNYSSNGWAIDKKNYNRVVLSWKSTI